MTEKDKFGYYALITCLAILAFIIINLPTPSMKVKGVDALTVCQVFKEAEAPLTILMNVSGFCKESCCCGVFADGITASGEPAEGYFVAAPPDYPFGTLMAIPGYAGGKFVPVLDRGGAIKGNKLDVFFKTHQEALEWGRQELEVEVKL